MKNQSGRSMIEMLGVLAIIGVLSLGGVAVFNAVMNRHTANTLTYDVMLMAESTVSLGPQEQMPFDASTEYDQMSSVLVAGVANVIVNDVDKEICDILISKGGNGVFVLEKQADGSPLTDCDDEGTDIVFAFRDGYLPEAGVCNPSCDPGHICSNGQCCPNVIPEKACSIESTEACAGVTPPSKRDGTPCGENGDGSCQNGDCIEGDTCDILALNCGAEQYRDEENCLCVCETKGLTGYDCSYSCPSSASGRVSGLSKSACEACGNTVWNDGDCYRCGYIYSLPFDTEEEAEACASACAAGTGYEWTAEGNYCYGAPSTECPGEWDPTFNMTKSVCEACGNAVWSDGSCYDCGYLSPLSFATELEAEACVRACADSGYKRTAVGTYCYLATNPPYCPLTSSYEYMSKSACEACGNTVWNNGYCYGCEYVDILLFDTETEAEACANACASRTAEGRYCYWAPSTDCPSEVTHVFSMTKSACEACENAFWNDGYCYFCGYLDSISSFATEEEARACASACVGSGYEWTAEGRYCYRSPSTACPSNMTPTYNTTKSACEACENAFWNDGYCYFCGYSDSISSFATEEEAEACVSACADSRYPREVDKFGDLYYCNRK